MKKSVLALSLTLALGTAHAAPGVTQAQFRALEARIAQLEADSKILRKQAADATAQAQAARAALAQVRNVPSGAAGQAGSATVALPQMLQAPATADATGSTPAVEDLAAPEDLAATDASAATAPADAPSSLASADGNAGSSAANAFNPAISIVLNGSYSHHSLDPSTYARSGFPLAGEAGPGPNGFSLGESEVSLAANIDDKLYGQLTLTASSEDGQDRVGVEEAFIDTTSLPNGFSVRAGRFFSNIGYLNSHHTHTDNFFDRPLAYQAFVGSQFGDDGVQVRWVAPTSLFVEIGGEAFRGGSYPAAGGGHGGVGAKSVFAHVGGDIGSESSYLAGVSALRTTAVAGDDGFTGDATLYVADGTFKWAPQGNFKDGGVTLRSEYFLDHRDGSFADPVSGASTLWSGQRRGAYLETVYRINRSWDVGYRYDRLWAANDGPLASSFDPFRHSAELTWRNSEFSLVRLQLSHDKPNAAAADNAVTVQYQTSLGAHGAHKF